MVFYRIDWSYHTWYWHGEKALSGGPPAARAKCYDRIHFSDVCSTIETVHATHDDYKANMKLFERWLEYVEKHSYPISRNFIKLLSLVKLCNLKTQYKWFYKSFLELLRLLGDMFPLNDEFPLSMYEAKMILIALGI